ncbi:MAG: tRNA pseudouridine(55) synthase TruB [Pseudomonadota bacterium]|nr:tRNA pseudouridine(55) synthase TruB [Pseudomonadota bacterium]
MAKRRGQPVHGWVNLDKPPGISSAKAVAIVRRVFDAIKAGHGGTLDPLASGVLPIALGEATKTVSYAMGKSKSYEFSLAWGSETSTDDTEGEVTRQSDIRPSADHIDWALAQFQGMIDQVPPDYSAIKIEGARAYDLARQAGAGQSLPALQPRKVQIDQCWRLESNQAGARFFVGCGKGTYIRALARDLGRALGSAAHVTSLRRLSVGKFHANNAISLDFLEKLTHSSAAFEHLHPVLSALDDIPALPISRAEARKLRHGQKLPALGATAQQRFAMLMTGGTAIAVEGETPIALVALKAGAICPVRVLNL